MLGAVRSATSRMVLQDSVLVPSVADKVMAKIWLPVIILPGDGSCENVRGRFKSGNVSNKNTHPKSGTMNSLLSSKGAVSSWEPGQVIAIVLRCHSWDRSTAVVVSLVMIRMLFSSSKEGNLKNCELKSKQKPPLICKTHNSFGWRRGS